MASISVNIRGLNQFSRALKQTEANVATKTQQALNRTLQRARTQMTNAVGERLNLKKKPIRDLVSIQRATKITGLIGKLIVKNKPVPLLEYNAKQNRKGVSFKIFRNRSRQLIKHAFITSDRRARDTVFKREGAARLKIKPLYGTRVTDVAGDKLEQVKVFAKDFIFTELTRQLSSKP